MLQDQEIRTGIKEYSDWPTIPQLYVKGEFVGGSDIMMEMFESGELQQLVRPRPEECGSPVTGVKGEPPPNLTAKKRGGTRDQKTAVPPLCFGVEPSGRHIMLQPPCQMAEIGRKLPKNM